MTTRLSTITYQHPVNISNLFHSDTLVIHRDDPSTAMLKQIYEGKGYDVLTSSFIPKDQVHELLAKHHRIIMLGHGSAWGLIGGIIGDREAEMLKGKELFAIWCNADKYFTYHNIGHGCFITKNVPSEKIECEWIGANVPEEWILENITYWTKCIADVMDIVWINPAEAVRLARLAYQKSKTVDSTPDEIKVIDYNTDAIQVLS